VEQKEPDLLEPAEENLVDLKRVERRLVARLAIGLVLIVMTVVGGLGSWLIYSRVQEARETIALTREHMMQVRKEILQAQLDQVVDYLGHTRSRTEATLKSGIRDYVDLAYELTLQLYKQEHGHVPEALLQRHVIEAIRPLRFFGGRGYYFVDGMDGKCILLPTAPRFEGTSLYDNRDDTGHYIMRDLIRAAREPSGEGFSRYRWYAPDDPRHMAEKIAYVRLFEPWGWVIGAGEYLQVVEEELKRQALERLRALHFANSGHVFVLDRDGSPLVTPDEPNLEGRLRSQLPEELQKLGSLFLDKAAAGGGFVSYVRTPPSPNGPGPAVAFDRMADVVRIEPWGWVVGTALNFDDIDRQTQERLSDVRRQMVEAVSTTLIFLCLATLAALTASLLYARWFHGLLRDYRRSLATQAVTLRKRDEDLSRANLELKRSNEELERFAYVASHDLREPLRMVTSFLSLLERRLGTAMEGESQEFLDFARDGARRMDRMICDLLEYSRLGRGQTPPTKVPLDEAIAEALQNLQPRIEEASADIQIAPDLPAIQAVPGEMVRLFQNLIGNALKYRSPDRPCQIAVTVQREDGHVHLRVIDNGIGIALGQRNQVFGIFQRLHDRKIEGTGIGLASCKKIVLGHGGAIDLEDGRDGGLAVHVCLPIGLPSDSRKGGSGPG